MAHLNLTTDRLDGPTYPVMQYFESYGAHFEGRWFATMGLAGDAKDMQYVRIWHMGEAFVCS